MAQAKKSTCVEENSMIGKSFNLFSASYSWQSRNSKTIFYWFTSIFKLLFISNCTFEFFQQNLILKLHTCKKSFPKWRIHSFRFLLHICDSPTLLESGNWLISMFKFFSSVLTGLGSPIKFTITNFSRVKQYSTFISFILNSGSEFRYSERSKVQLVNVEFSRD